MIAPEATIVESFGEITILNQLDSVVPQKSEKLYQQLEIRNAQLEWKFHKSQAEIIELSIKLKVFHICSKVKPHDISIMLFRTQ